LGSPEGFSAVTADVARAIRRPPHRLRRSDARRIAVV